MPSKSSKAASRQSQAQNRNRKRKANKTRGPQVMEGLSESTDSSSVMTADAETEVNSQSAARQPVATAPARTATPRPAARQNRRRREAAEPLVFKYLGAELRQIAIISVIMVAILVALSFVL